MDIETAKTVIEHCRTILELQDRTEELREQSRKLERDAAEASKTADETRVRLAELIGDRLEACAFKTHNPSDGRMIVVRLSKRKDYDPHIERLPFLQISDNEEGA